VINPKGCLSVSQNWLSESRARQTPYSFKCIGNIACGQLQICTFCANFSEQKTTEFCVFFCLTQGDEMRRVQTKIIEPPRRQERQEFVWILGALGGLGGSNFLLN
jgi:hypothetical protein